MTLYSLGGLQSLALAADKLSAELVDGRHSSPLSPNMTLAPIVTEIQQWQAMSRPNRRLPQPDLPSIRNVLPSYEPTSIDTRQKMSLHFIAPPSTQSETSSERSSTPHKGEDPSRSPGLSSSASTYSSSSRSLPSPVWYPSPTFELDSGKPHHHTNIYSITSIDSSLPPSPNFQPAHSPFRNRSQYQTGPREDRHPYDDDERYALLYLRTVQNHKWDAVVAAFRELFPPKEARRCVNSSARPCPSSYVRRCVQGLQCRFYRIREEEGLKPLRDGRHAVPVRGDRRDDSHKFRAPEGGWRREKDILDQMVREGRVHPDIVKACKEMGKKKSSKV